MGGGRARVSEQMSLRSSWYSNDVCRPLSMVLKKQSTKTNICRSYKHRKKHKHVYLMQDTIQLRSDSCQIHGYVMLFYKNRARFDRLLRHQPGNRAGVFLHCCGSHATVSRQIWLPIPWDVLPFVCARMRVWRVYPAHTCTCRACSCTGKSPDAAVLWAVVTLTLTVVNSLCDVDCCSQLDCPLVHPFSRRRS